MATANRFPSPVSAQTVRASRARAHALSSRSARSRSSLATWSARTWALSTRNTSSGGSESGRYMLTPTTTWRPESMRPCVRAAASSMRSFGIPASMALRIPPVSSTSAMCCRARSARSAVRRSTWKLPPRGPRRDGFRSRAAGTAGCCGLCAPTRRSAGPGPRRGRWCVVTGVPPWVAAMASRQVRTTLLLTSLAVRLQPEVWQWVRSAIERGSEGENCSMSSDQSRRPARSFATSMKKSMPIPQKKLSLGAKPSTSRPASTAARTYSIPLASV